MKKVLYCALVGFIVYNVYDELDKYFIRRKQDKAFNELMNALAEYEGYEDEDIPKDWNKFLKKYGGGRK